MYEPDYIIVQDSTLIKDVNVFMGVKKGGIVIVNTEKKPDYKVPEGVKLITIDATSIALKVAWPAYHQHNPDGGVCCSHRRDPVCCS